MNNRGFTQTYYIIVSKSMPVKRSPHYAMADLLFKTLRDGASSRGLAKIVGLQNFMF